MTNLDVLEEIFSKEEIEKRKDEIRKRQQTKIENELKIRAINEKELEEKRAKGWDRIIVWTTTDAPIDNTMGEPIYVVPEEIPEEPPEIPEKVIEVVEANPEDLEAEKEENGKVKCPICGNEYAPQGFSRHFDACQKKRELLKKKEALEKELSGIGE